MVANGAGAATVNTWMCKLFRAHDCMKLHNSIMGIRRSSTSKGKKHMLKLYVTSDESVEF